jgi:hypothetical protein
LGNCCSTGYPTQDITFTPSTAGSYTFYARADSQVYGWVTGQSVTVTVAVACPNGSGVAGSCTSCNSGYTLSGGSCYPTCVNGSGPAGSCTSCNSGYVLSGGNCALQCPNGFGATGLCTSCNSGYTLNGGNCTLIPTGTISSALTATPSRVHPKGSTTLTWATSNMASCSVKSSDSVQTSPLPYSAINSPTGGLLISNITRPETYTLSCLDGSSKLTTSQVQVKLVPVEQEI